MARKHGIAFYSEDFRKGWHISKALSTELELYKQKYCGCIYSEMDRYRKKGNIDTHGVIPATSGILPKAQKDSGQANSRPAGAAGMTYKESLNLDDR
jgi:predicted adenine nucleotide alpha hydrolase (AANH) superfamily ATPase